MAMRRAHPFRLETVRRIRRMRWRRLSAGAGLAVSLALAATAAGLAHAIAWRHFARRDFSRDRMYTLSPQTIDLLRDLTNTVEVTVMLRPGRELDDALALLAEYESHTRRIRIRRIDPDRDVAAMNEAARRLSLAAPDGIAVVCGDRLRVLDAAEFYEEDRRLGPGGVERTRRAFRGEQAMTSAIHEVTRSKAPVVYALAGHGELALDETERLRGMAGAARRIRREGVDIRPLTISEDAGIPADCGALLIAGPRTRLPQPELDALQAYLDRSGRALILLDSGVQTGLESWLRRWGVDVGDDRVVDEGRNLGGGLLVTRFARHGVTDRLRDLACIFYGARSIEPAAGTAGGIDRPRVVRLALTSDRGWAETEFANPPWMYDEGRDRRGPVAVAAAVERGDPDSLAFGLRPTRLVVVGDSVFIANGAMVSGNADLLLGALNWLLERRERIHIASKPISPRRIEIESRSLRWLAVLLIGGVPAGVLALGAAVWWRRRA